MLRRLSRKPFLEKQLPQLKLCPPIGRPISLLYVWSQSLPLLDAIAQRVNCFILLTQRHMSITFPIKDFDVTGTYFQSLCEPVDRFFPTLIVVILVADH